MLLFAFVYKDDTQRIISQLLCSNIFVLPSPWLMLLSTLSSFKSLWMDQKWNQFIFSSLAFQGRYFICWTWKKWYVLCQLCTPWVTPENAWLCHKSELIWWEANWTQVPFLLLMVANCSLREGRRQRICIPWHWWCRQLPPLSFVFKSEPPVGGSTNHHTAGRIIWGRHSDTRDWRRICRK